MNTTILTRNQLIQAGQALYGERWQTDLAKALNIDSRRVRQWLSDERPTPIWLTAELIVLLEKNSQQTTTLAEQFKKYTKV